MTNNGITTQMQKELGLLQHELAQLDSKLEAKLDAKLDLRFKEFREDFKREMRGEIIYEMLSIFEQYFPPPPLVANHSGVVDRDKGVLGTLPIGFQSRDHVIVAPMGDLSQTSTQSRSSFGEGMGRGYQVNCPRFDGSDFIGWCSKLEQFFEAENVEDSIKVRLVILNLEERALQWHHFFAQRHGGIRQLSWDMYMRALQERFGSTRHLDPMTELVALKHIGIVKQYYDIFVGLLNQLHLPEIYALRIFMYNLKLDIGQYLRLLKTMSLAEAFNSAIEIEDIIGLVLRKNFSVMRNSNVAKPMLSSVKGLNVQSTRTYNVNNFNSKPPIKALSQAEMEDRRKKGLCFWCSAKYSTGQECNKSQLF